MFYICCLFGVGQRQEALCDTVSDVCLFIGNIKVQNYSRTSKRKVFQKIKSFPSLPGLTFDISRKWNSFRDFLFGKLHTNEKSNKIGWRTYILLMPICIWKAGELPHWIKVHSVLYSSKCGARNCWKLKHLFTNPRAITLPKSCFFDEQISCGKAIS